MRLLDHLFDFDEIRVHSRRSESREAFAERLRKDLGKPVIVTDDWASTVRGADIVVEASRLDQPEPLLRTDWIKPGAFVVPYGTMSAVELSLTDIMSKLVVDKTRRLVERVLWLASIELMVAAQAVDLRGELRLGQGVRQIHEAVRGQVAHLDQDRSGSVDVLALSSFISNGCLKPFL